MTVNWLPKYYARQNSRLYTTMMHKEDRNPHKIPETFRRLPKILFTIYLKLRELPLQMKELKALNMAGYML